MPPTLCRSEPHHALQRRHKRETAPGLFASVKNLPTADTQYAPPHCVRKSVVIIRCADFESSCVRANESQPLDKSRRNHDQQSGKQQLLCFSRSHHSSDISLTNPQDRPRHSVDGHQPNREVEASARGVNQRPNIRQEISNLLLGVSPRLRALAGYYRHERSRKLP